MLAKNFKTPVVLGISDREFEALVKVLGMLERGELTYVKINFTDCYLGLHIEWGYKHGFTGHFNMLREIMPHKCETVACILGTVRLLYGRDLFQSWSARKHIDNLFYGPLDQQACEDVTPSQAAIALRNYLTHGEPRWTEALA